MVELGAIPLLIKTLQPNEKAFSMGMTLIGIMFRGSEAALLSHRKLLTLMSRRKPLFSQDRPSGVDQSKVSANLTQCRLHLT